MTLPEIPAGAEVLIDANVLIFARRGASRQCAGLLERCANGEVHGYVSALTIGEFSHRRMIQEAQSLQNLGSNPARALAKDRNGVRSLRVYSSDVERLLSSELDVLSCEAGDFYLALKFQREHGLLTNDSLILAAASRAGIKSIASHDEDFATIPGFELFRPTDVGAAVT